MDSYTNYSKSNSNETDCNSNCNSICLLFLILIKKKKLTCASGPSSMLQAVHGFQFGCGGDQDTTPAGCGFKAAKSSKI